MTPLKGFEAVCCSYNPQSVNDSTTTEEFRLRYVNETDVEGSRVN